MSIKSIPILGLLILPLVALAQETELSVPGQNLFVNKINVQQSLLSILNGSGITVSIKEFRFDSNDVDFRGRVLGTSNAAADQSTHATIMASLVGGAGNGDAQGRGAAPGCRLVSSSFIGLMPDEDYITPNITVQNHSYGLDIQNWYGAGAVAYDETTMENPGLLHVFSAGNRGDSLSLSGNYAGIPGFSNLTGNFKMAKNVLTVGAVDSFVQVAPLSSRGPAFDGRVKPDLVAFGQDGSSGAAALVSGSAAVIQQALPIAERRSDLVRAILLNSADDIGTPGPDFESGFGNLNLFTATWLAVNKQYTLGSLQGGQTVSLPIQIPDKVRQFKITLTWNDPPANLLAPKALLHDLDFNLVSQVGELHFPWVLNTAAHPDSLQQSARRGRDSLNNVEQITLGFPSAGLWEIRVIAPQGMTGAQDFALVWSWDTLEHFAWNYPFANDPAPANTEVVLRWETNLPDSFARLEWRPWPSPDWKLVKDSIPLQRGWQRWILPDTFAESQVRMVVGNKAVESDIFLVTKELRMKIGFNCADSVALFWNSAHPTAHYNLYGLGAQQMDWLMEVSDTFVVLQKSAFPQIRFAVAPLAPWEDAQGPRSPAPDISTQGVDCYFKNFLAALNDDLEVDLGFEIGATYGVTKVSFEKKIGENFVSLYEQTANQTVFEFVDEHPFVGSNTYQARLYLLNGESILSESATVYFAGNKGWWVFPNPALADGTFNVVSKTDGEAVFSLFDATGKQVKELTLEDIRVEIPLGNLPRGLYFYEIKNQDVFLGGGKLMLR